MNQTIQECVVSMLQHSGLSDGFWTGSKPNYDKLRIFGCKVYALIPEDDRRKLEPRSRKCVFLGYGLDGD